MKRLFKTGDLITWRSASQRDAWYIGLVSAQHPRRGGNARCYTIWLLPPLRGELVGEGRQDIGEVYLRKMEARLLTENEQRELDVREFVEAL